MIFKLMNFDKQLRLSSEVVSVIEILNKEMFSKFVESLILEEGQMGAVPYLLMDDEFNSINPKNKAIIIDSLPFINYDNKLLSNNIYTLFSTMLRSDDETLVGVNNCFYGIVENIRKYNLSTRCTYDFMIEFDEKVFMKAFCFKPLSAPRSSLLDKIIVLLNFMVDAGVNKPLFFVNLKLFLSENDLLILYEQAFLNKISLLLVEGVSDSITFDNEEKIVIDHDFIEF